MRVRKTFAKLQIGATLAVCFACCCTLTGCLVAGYSSGGGFWVWPGSIVITLVIVLIWYFSRR
jgi:hypothetical protein